MKLLLKIFFLVSLVSVIVFSIFVNYIYILNNNKQTTRLDKKISIYNANYSKIITKLLFNFNVDVMEVTLNSLALDPEIYEIKLFDYSGEVNIKVENKNNSKVIYKTSELTLEMDNIELGKLVIIYAKDQVINQIENFTLQIIEVTILLSILLIVILYGLIYYFLKRLKVLALAAEEIASGNLDYSIKIKSDDEIGQVAEKFESMRINLKNRIKLVNEQLQFQQLLIDSINIPIYIKNKKLEYITCNDAYLKFIGSTKDESIIFKNQELKDIFTQLESKVIENYKDISENFTFNNFKNEPIDIILSNNIFYDDKDNLGGLVGSVFDITQINEAKKRIEKFNDELQSRVNEQTKELTISNKELESSIHELQITQNELIEAEKMASLGGLVAGVAHEINTPIGIGLTGITHFSSQLKITQKLYKSGDMTEEELEEFFSSSESLSSLITSNLQRTAELVKSFKQISVDQSSEQKRVFNLHHYLKEIILSLKAELKKTKLNIQSNCPEDIDINSFPGVYSQIFTNFILNSIIHAYDNEKEGILSIIVEKSKGNICLIYSDDGKGIDKENLSKIFDPFFTTNRHEGGSGLGLNVIYNLVTTKLKGNIVCESTKGNGVKFIINIPL
jgi:signal transduction histidine kinase/HAMP domain-containing protein